MEYIILYASSPKELIKEVNAYISNGWRSQGGVAFTSSYWAQAMIRD